METILNKNLERAKNPESVGISSKVIREMLDEMEREDCELHSLMILRHGKVAVETYQAPLTRDDTHMVYSVSKSFLATAFGFALDEGLLTKETKFLDIFPDYRPKKRDKYLEKLTIGHLVSMTIGKAASVKGREEKDWLKIFIDAKWALEPGTDWRYINDNFYVAAAAITRVAKMSVTEYLTPRLFEPLGIDVPVWEKSPTGIEAGGWGLFLKTEDIAKLILCYMNGGKYNDEQVIPEWWTKEATAYHNDNSSSQSKPDSKAGYGYGFWRCAGMENT
ncbi:MAG: serine hydrolase, partial [Clostridia bacterium]|nr:serine hydrolase [Clostridia bacterium]